MPKNFMRGVNLSHWLSQSQAYERNHLDNAIRLEDFQRIADTGADHVRLPVDHKLLEDREGNLGHLGIPYVDFAYKCCRESGLAMLLDLHNAPGMNFATPEANDIWKRDDLQRRFAAIWSRLACHFGDSDPEHLAFELLNEPTADDNEDWNRVATVGFEAIRAVSKTRTIFVGSNSWQSPFTFPALKVFRDPALVYAFHFYEPFIFTHQKASWVKHLKILDMAVEYPSVVPDLSTQAAALPTEQMREQTMIYSGQSLDKARLLRTLGNVLDFMKANNAEAYCSEFGVFNKASSASTLNWFSDIVDIFKSKGIGWSVWDYKGGFAIFEKDGTPKPEAGILFNSNS